MDHFTVLLPVDLFVLLKLSCKKVQFFCFLLLYFFNLNKILTVKVIFFCAEEPSLLWVDKYQPWAVKQIIGQQGDKSNMRKLMNWLRDCEKNRKKPVSKCEYTLIVKMLFPQIHVHVTSLQASMQTVQANCWRKQMKKFGL